MVNAVLLDAASPPPSPSRTPGSVLSRRGLTLICLHREDRIRPVHPGPAPYARKQATLTLMLRVSSAGSINFRSKTRTTDLLEPIGLFGSSEKAACDAFCGQNTARSLHQPFKALRLEN